MPAAHISLSSTIYVSGPIHSLSHTVTLTLIEGGEVSCPVRSGFEKIVNQLIWTKVFIEDEY